MRVGAAMATIYVVWGSTYLAIMVAIESVPPLSMLAVRFLAAGALLYVWARRKHAAPTAGEWRAAAISGTALMAGGTGAVAWAELELDSGLAALIVALVPLWLALFDRTRLSLLAMVGLGVGFAGVALLVGPGSAAFVPATAVLVLGTLAWAWASVYSRTAPLPANGLGAAMQMLAGGAALVLLGAARGEWADLGSPSLDSTLALAYLIVFGSLLAFTAYAWLLRTVRTSLVGTYAFVNPIVAVLLGTVFLDEPLTVRTLAAGAIVVAGVALIILAPRRSEQAPQPAAIPVRAR